MPLNADWRAPVARCVLGWRVGDASKAALNGGVDRTINVWINARGERQLRTSSIIVFNRLGDGAGYFLLFATLASLVLIGPRQLWRGGPAMRGVMGYLTLCLFTYGFVYFGQHRYRVTMEPFMILVATPFLTYFWSLRGRRLDVEPSPR